MPFEKGNKLGVKFTAENQPPNAGRKPKLKSIPEDAREQVYAALYHALSLPDAQTAGAYLMREAENLPEFGYLIQVYAKGLMGKHSLMYASDILDRLFGKPKQTTETQLKVDAGEEIGIRIVDTRKRDGSKVQVDYGETDTE